MLAIRKQCVVKNSPEQKHSNIPGFGRQKKRNACGQLVCASRNRNPHLSRTNSEELYRTIPKLGPRFFFNQTTAADFWRMFRIKTYL